MGAHSSKVSAIGNQLSRQSDRTRAQNQNQSVLDAVSKILAANQHLEQRLQTAESKLQQQAEQIRVHAANAMTDALTGLANRRAFDAELARRLAEYQRYGKAFCLMILDIDHFKKFNDTYGHLAGDQVLRLVGDTLKTTVRTPDFVARYGGEEFAVIMPQTSLDEGSRGGERIRAGIEQAQCIYEDQKLQVTASIGVAQVAAGQSAPVLIHCADEALYRSKQSGRNQVQAFHPTVPAAAEAESKRPAPIANTTQLPVAHHESVIDKPTATRDESEDLTRSSPDTRTDAETGLPNRTEFCEETRRRLAEMARHGGRLSVMLIEIDHLEKLVAQHGRPMEDLMLKTCTQFLTAAMRDMDLVARYDLAAFAVVLPGTPLMHAVGASERLRTAIEHCPLQLAGQRVKLSVSVGVAEAEVGEDSVSFVTRATDAHRVAIDAGGNRVFYHTGTSIEALPESEPAETV